MRPRELSYRCSVCRWQGQLEPVDAGDAAPCPDCGVYLYPLTWVQTWGVALVLVGVGVAVAAALLLQ
jgi:DNA-directed RNA polymerase subunit RPC12/RpoP